MRQPYEGIKYTRIQVYVHRAHRNSAADEHFNTQVHAYSCVHVLYVREWWKGDRGQGESNVKREK